MPACPTIFLIGFQPLIMLVSDLDEIVQKSEQSVRDGHRAGDGAKGVVDAAENGCRRNDGDYENDTAHRGRSALSHMLVHIFKHGLPRFQLAHESEHGI